MEQATAAALHLAADGAVFGLLLAFALYFPRRTVLLITGTAGGVAHFAHLGGMVGGYLLIRSWRSR